MLQNQPSQVKHLFRCRVLLRPISIKITLKGVWRFPFRHKTLIARFNVFSYIMDFRWTSKQRLFTGLSQNCSRTILAFSKNKKKGKKWSKSSYDPNQSTPSSHFKNDHQKFKNKTEHAMSWEFKINRDLLVITDITVCAKTFFIRIKLVLFLNSKKFLIFR